MSSFSLSNLGLCDPSGSTTMIKIIHFSFRIELIEFVIPVKNNKNSLICTRKMRKRERLTILWGPEDPSDAFPEGIRSEERIRRGVLRLTGTLQPRPVQLPLHVLLEIAIEIFFFFLFNPASVNLCFCHFLILGENSPSTLIVIGKNSSTTAFFWQSTVGYLPPLLRGL